MSGVFHVYGHLGVPVCLVWDTDSGNDDRAGPRINRGLQGPAGPETPAGQNPLAPMFGPRCSCPDASLSAATIGQVEGIEGRFDRPAFERSAFFREVLPSILAHFAKGRDAGECPEGAQEPAAEAS